MSTRRKFLTTGALGGAAALAAPNLARAQSTIRWRLQTYAGTSLGAQVAKPAIDMFNAIAGDEMQIDLYYADQLVPTDELFQAMQRGTIDAVQSDDDSMAGPTEVTVFGGYFPFASRYSLDVPALFNDWGLNEIWADEYERVGVKHISAGAWDPCHFITSSPITSLAELSGKRVFTFPTAGRFLSQFGVVPVTVPWEDVEIALQTREIDGVAWCGITEAYEVGWADICSHFLTNNISGAWIGHFFANMDRWEELPEHLQNLMATCFEQSHYYRQHWYWAGEARLRTEGDKLELTSIPDEEWATVEQAARVFWDEIAQESEVKAKVVQIFKDYNAAMDRAGRPYRYG
jgi:TRAP-type mannitol/chloroaromatic compound transport system substrate-binding protein